MVLRAVHMAEGQVHHPPEDGRRVCGGLRQAQAEDAVHALGVAVIAHIMAIDAPGLAGLLFMADGALHDLVLDQVFQRRLADQAFLCMHPDHSPLVCCLFRKQLLFYRIYPTITTSRNRIQPCGVPPDIV